MRHAAALVTCLSMLLLLLGGGDAASCASHGTERMPGMTQASSPMAMTHATMAHDQHTGVAGEPSDCATPAQLPCCAMSASCGVATVVGVAYRAEGPSPVAGTRHAEPGTLLLSVAPAPEPPPPRA